jgi:phosphoglycerate-specific signal transduction histidine kinase
MARKATCPKCDQVIEHNQNFKSYKNKKYHVECYKKLVDDLYNVSQNNQNSKQELYEYICKLFNIQEITSLMKIQLDKYYTDYNFTYDGMLYTLKYFFDILENDITKAEGIGIIPYMYQEAKEFYILKNHLEQLELNLNDIEKTVKNKVVKIKPIYYTKPKIIDMNNL